MSRRAWSDNLDRVVIDPGDEATADDGRFSASMMRRALALTAATQPHPNPRVGAVIVQGGARAAGQPEEHF